MTDKRPVGRPRVKEYDLEAIRNYAMVGCPDREIAYLIGVSPSRFVELKAARPEIQQVLEFGRSNLHESLRRRQVEKALSGDVKMLIHLGRVMLGQREEYGVEMTNKGETQYILQWPEQLNAPYLARGPEGKFISIKGDDDGDSENDP
jgi:hypothetical protein